MSDYRFGGDYKLSIYPKDAMDGWGEIDMNKVEAVEIEWVDFIRKPDDKSRWAELFGTPERAANTILALQICPMSKDECGEFCPAHDVCFEFYKDGRTVYEMAEWLRGDAE